LRVRSRPLNSDPAAQLFLSIYVHEAMVAQSKDLLVFPTRRLPQKGKVAT
jgi:hypothetical protein